MFDDEIIFNFPKGLCMQQSKLLMEYLFYKSQMHLIFLLYILLIKDFVLVLDNLRSIPYKIFQALANGNSSNHDSKEMIEFDYLPKGKVFPA